MDPCRSVQIQGTEHLMPCLNVFLVALEVPELDSCFSSRAPDIIVACLDVAASGNEAHLLLALRKPFGSLARTSTALLWMASIGGMAGHCGFKITEASCLSLCYRRSGSSGQARKPSARIPVPS